MKFTKSWINAYYNEVCNIVEETGLSRLIDVSNGISISLKTTIVSLTKLII
jgi:hypothetical protein